MNEPTSNGEASPAIIRQIEATLRATNARAADHLARRAAVALASDIDGLREVLIDIVNGGVTPARAIDAELWAGTCADTLTLFFNALNEATGGGQSAA